MKLGLKKKQEREIVRVLVHCAGQEKRYNPYYGFIGEKLIQYSYDFKITFQYAFWDFLKSISDFELEVTAKLIRKISNMARLLSHLISLRAMSIVVLRVIFWFSVSLEANGSDSQLCRINVRPDLV